MISIRGLFIIASDEPHEVKAVTQYASNISFWGSAETVFKTMTRHLITVTLKKDLVDEVVGKLKKGYVCEIEHAYFYESGKVVKNAHGNGVKTSGIVIRVDYKNIKFLKLPLYYEDIEKITKEKNNNDN